MVTVMVLRYRQTMWKVYIKVSTILFYLMCERDKVKEMNDSSFNKIQVNVKFTGRVYIYMRKCIKARFVHSAILMNFRAWLWGGRRWSSKNSFEVNIFVFYYYYTYIYVYTILCKIHTTPHVYNVYPHSHTNISNACLWNTLIWKCSGDDNIHLWEKLIYIQCEYWQF